MTPVQARPVCLLLGSNIDPEKNLPRAINRLGELFSIESISTAWETPAVGSNGPDFLNAAVLLYTSMEADILKERVLRPIEAQLGRVRSTDKNAPRTIDIDVVIWDANLIDPGLWSHPHVAVPVAEILPCYPSPQTGEYLEQIAQRLTNSTPVKPRPEILPGLRQFESSPGHLMTT